MFAVLKFISLLFVNDEARNIFEEHIPKSQKIVHYFLVLQSYTMPQKQNFLTLH